MPSNLNLDYYYGSEAEQYSFYRIPKALMTDPRYKSVSVEAKVLYGLLLDRMGLSVKNGWMDSSRRVYIYFTQEDAMQMMDCGHNKAVKLFAMPDQRGKDKQHHDICFPTTAAMREALNTVVMDAYRDVLEQQATLAAQAVERLSERTAKPSVRGALQEAAREAAAHRPPDPQRTADKDAR